MFSLTSRIRIVIATSLVAILHLSIQNIDFRTLLLFDFPIDPIKPLVLSLTLYILSYWALFFKVNGERLITVLAFPAINMFAMSLFSELIIENMLKGIEQIGALIISLFIFWTFTYISLLTANLLNVAYIDKIPLGQAARASEFVLSLITAYIMFFMLFSNDIFVPLKIFSVFILGFILAFNTLWTIEIKYSQRVNASIIIGLVLTYSSTILSIWPVSAPYLALVLTLLFYIFLGIALEIREIISKSIWFEYIFLFILIVLLLVLVGEWGINGNLV